MKKYFRFLGVALLATTLCLAMVSCGDKNEDEGTEQGNNNGNNGNNNQGGGNGTVSVTLGSVASFNTPQDSLVAYDYNNTATIYASNGRSARLQGTSISYYFPCFRAAMPEVVGTYDTASSSMVYYTGEFYRFANQYGANCGEYPDWLPAGNISTRVTAFDATSMNISANMSGSMMYFYEGYYAYQTDPDTITPNEQQWNNHMAAATRANLNATITNVKLQQLSAKGSIVAKPIDD